MAFKKGQSGNPNGRPKGGASVDDLWKAIQRVQKKKRKKLLVYMVEQAYKDNKVLVALMKKIVPDIITTNVGITDALSDLLKEIGVGGSGLPITKKQT